MIHDPGIEVIAAQVVIAVGGKDLDDAVTNLDNGNIKGTAAQVIDHDLLLGAIIKAVS